MNRFFLFRFLALVCFVLMLAACAGKDDEMLPDKPPEELYGMATELMDKKDFLKAANAFEEVERQHPYSQWATRAKLLAAFARYQAMDYDDAIDTFERFIQLHPGNPNVAYAYYMRALCYYERLADVRRDQTNAQYALKALQDVISRFPETTYARDAALKLALVNDHLAGAEMEVGRNYIKQKLYTAAIGRFKTVVDSYQTTSHVPEALHRLVECYLALGVPNEAKAVAAVLGHNFPGSQWYQDSYALLAENNLSPAEAKGSWISRTWGKVF